MKDHTFLSDWSEDPCPAHGTPVKKCYTFGKYGDAEVWVFKGCGCAVAVHSASLMSGPALGHEVTYHTSYGHAAGRATLIKMSEGVKNAPFEGAY